MKTYVGQFNKQYAKTYIGQYTGSFEKAYIGVYDASWSGSTIQSSTSNISTTTLWVRIA